MEQKVARIIIGLAVVCIIALIIASIFGLNNSSSLEMSDIDTLYELDQNEEFIIKERWLSLGKCYEIFAVKDDKEVKIGEIRGKVLHIFGDVFTFYDMNDNVIAYEEEIYKFFKVTRSAEVYQADGTLMGYIAEDTFTKFFNPGYYFNYYDANRNEIGHSDQNVLSLFKNNGIYNVNGTKEYSINERFNLLTDEYQIISIENPTIPKLYVLFSACIEDAIRDSENTESSSQSSDEK